MGSSRGSTEVGAEESGVKPASFWFQRLPGATAPPHPPTPTTPSQPGSLLPALLLLPGVAAGRPVPSLLGPQAAPPHPRPLPLPLPSPALLPRSFAAPRP